MFCPIDFHSIKHDIPPVPREGDILKFFHPVVFPPARV